MTFAAILEIIQGVLKFPDAVLALVRMMKGTPAEQQQALLAEIQKTAENFQASGRPTWTE